MHLGKLDVVDLRINERLDMSEKLLGVVSASADDALSMSGMAWKVSGSVLHLWMLLGMLPLTCMGVVIAVMTAPINYSLIQAFHLSKRIFSRCWPQGFG